MSNDSHEQVLLYGRKGDASWEAFGERLREMMHEQPGGNLYLRAQLSYAGPPSLSSEIRMMVSLDLQECVVVEDGFIILKVLNRGALDMVDAHNEVDARAEQIAWRMNEEDAGDEMPVTELVIVRIQ